MGLIMNANGFTSNPGLQSSVANERFKPLFQSSPSVSQLKNDYLSDKNGLSLNIKAGESSGRQVFSKSIEFSLGVKFESSYEFKIPSPQDVAKTVLGFVENRINSEKQAGASLEKLNNLMSQARSGIEKGYAQAEADIKGLGLMTDDLADDISKGLGLINEGLGNIEANLDKTILTSVAGAVNEKLGGSSAPSKLDGSQLANFFSKTSDNALNEEAQQVAPNKLVSLSQFSESKAEFVLNTQEGDQVLIRFADLQALSYNKSKESGSLNVSQSTRFEFSVKGDLNKNELQAINNILEQAENVSSLFFSDQFEQAFNSALNLGFDPEQIASFSLDLSKLQVQEVRTYQESSKTALDSYKRNQPLINVAQQFEKFDALLQPLARFEKVNSMVESLISKALENYEVEVPNTDAELRGALDNYQLFSSKLLGEVLSGDENRSN